MIIEPKREILLWPLMRIGLTRSWAARDHFIRLGVLPLIALLIIAVPFKDTLDAAQLSAASGRGDPAVVLQGALLGLCYGAVIALFSVNWIRQLTLGPSGAPGLGVMLSARHFRFFFLVLGVTLMIMLPAMVVASLAALLLQSEAVGVLAALVLGMLLWAALLARLSPTWIGIAIDARMPIGTAWRRTAGQGFKLLLAMIAVEVGTMLAQQIVAALLDVVGLSAAAPFASLLLIAALGLVGIAVQLAVLVSAFPHFLRETV
jgi:hypothetical protein